jgi:CheY-like chemotaxis protein
VLTMGPVECARANRYSLQPCASRAVEELVLGQIFLTHCSEALFSSRSILVAKVASCDNGMDAIRLMSGFRPEVAIFDVGMLGMDEFEVARAYREDPSIRHLVLLALTG